MKHYSGILIRSLGIQHDAVVHAQGYVAVWSRNGTIMSCESAPERTTPKWVNGVGAGMSSGGFWVLVALGSLVWYKHRVQFRRKWQRERELMKDRGRGVPSGSAATIVVTDVEGYSGEQ